eukprot:Gregarina_sp_Pseudo_9__2561@NODE_282_length_3298_cov_44_769254_g264_i0_p1_GENE_NODE_282_length_3298_cov_44_769254_g264_i0NODE_282_length_3298_cov_44_769254_g264_i0_p1_ORF_typecomplete_len834_score124_85IIGP/PF05049_13/4_4e36FeoB_N/PF02421_18/1_3e05TPR_21/PF09976_9/0_0016MMR_HSR1/PF01926_23/0_0034PAP_PilO/PF06864_12/0_038RsgA_GTPase/PF03193_16/1_1RsgA_GTPase/PF03193_16/4e02stn_TNFRSF12A/PF12191_8/1_6e04stn_TNFRSF12A/PF12191_8/8_8e03stn_TNFRSF12A/PF12191_8/0_12DUF3767/PF12597_8/0_41Mid2/PF04478_12
MRLHTAPRVTRVCLHVIQHPVQHFHVSIKRLHVLLRETFCDARPNNKRDVLGPHPASVVHCEGVLTRFLGFEFENTFTGPRHVGDFACGRDHGERHSRPAFRHAFKKASANQGGPRTHNLMEMLRSSSGQFESDNHVGHEISHERFPLSRCVPCPGFVSAGIQTLGRCQLSHLFRVHFVRRNGSCVGPVDSGIQWLTCFFSASRTRRSSVDTSLAARLLDVLSSQLLLSHLLCLRHLLRLHHLLLLQQLLLLDKLLLLLLLLSHLLLDELRLGNLLLLLRDCLGHLLDLWNLLRGRHLLRRLLHGRFDGRDLRRGDVSHGRLGDLLHGLHLRDLLHRLHLRDLLHGLHLRNWLHGLHLRDLLHGLHLGNWLHLLDLRDLLHRHLPNSGILRQLLRLLNRLNHDIKGGCLLYNGNSGLGIACPCGIRRRLLGRSHLQQEKCEPQAKGEAHPRRPNLAVVFYSRQRSVSFSSRHTCHLDTRLPHLPPRHTPASTHGSLKTHTEFAEFSAMRHAVLWEQGMAAAAPANIDESGGVSPDGWPVNGVVLGVATVVVVAVGVYVYYEWRRRSQLAQAAEAISSWRKEEKDMLLLQKQLDVMEKTGANPSAGATQLQIESARRSLGFKPGCVHIALAGLAGAGRSSFVNAVRGVRDTSSDAAPVGLVNASGSLGPFSSGPTQFYDLPGAGTREHARYDYVNEQKLWAFQAVIVLTSSRTTDIDCAIARDCHKLHIPYLMVRTKCDEFLNNIRNDLADESENRNWAPEVYARRLQEATDELRNSTEAVANAGLAELGVPPQRIYLVNRRSLYLFKTQHLRDENSMDEEILLDAIRRLPRLE